MANEFYSDALPFLDRSIQSDWTSGETYLLKAIALRHLKYSKEDNQEILINLELAEENATTDLPWVWQEKGLIHLRLNDHKAALNDFIMFEEYFAQDQSETTLWARKMIAKLQRRMN